MQPPAMPARSEPFNTTTAYESTSSDADVSEAIISDRAQPMEMPFMASEVGYAVEQIRPSEVERVYDSPRVAVPYTPREAVAHTVWPGIARAASPPVPIRTSVTASRVYSTSETPEAKALRALAEAGYANLSIQDLSRLLPPDSREKELIVMADVRAYFHVAYKVSLAYSPCFNVFIASSSASLTIFL
jgi:hypothetical protein